MTVTASLMLAVYAIVHGNAAGWTSAQTLVQLGVALGVALVLAIAFVVVVESRVPQPLMPLRLFARSFISALHLQRVLHYGAMQTGLAFLPASVVMAGFSRGLSPKRVMRFGIRATLSSGLLVAI
ncbi:hypothetical protein [Burkholderia sp. LMG 32019]|uniref:hypothetical protein n=1 Tax=Burkholderia sp. LMG 32019 TaxID=3158173 RepID=UPI003C3011DE